MSQCLQLPTFMSPPRWRSTLAESERARCCTEFTRPAVHDGAASPWYTNSIVLPGPSVSLAQSAVADPPCTMRMAPVVPPIALKAGTGRVVIVLRFNAQLILAVQVVRAD